MLIDERLIKLCKQPKHGTTILSVRKGNKVTVIGDGQITHGSVVMKHNAVKVRRVGNVLVGVAGSAADALTLLEKFEKYLEESGGELLRAVVNLAKQWRVDRSVSLPFSFFSFIPFIHSFIPFIHSFIPFDRTMYRLHATMCMSDKKSTLLFDGEGNVIEPDDQRLLAIGSGGYFALAAARALLDHSNLDAEQIAREAMTIAADLCIHTNKNFTVQTLEIDSPTPDEKPGSPPFV